MKEHLETLENMHDGNLPKNIIADAGYGSEENYEYLCDYGRTLVFLYEQYLKSDNGYKSLIRVYECLDCSGCPHRDQCVKFV